MTKDNPIDESDSALFPSESDLDALEPIPEESPILMNANNDNDDFNNASTTPHYFPRKEDVVKIRSKILVFVVLIATTAIVSITTFIHTNHQMDEEFEARFDEVANDIVQGVTGNALHTLESYRFWSLQVTTHAIATKAVWPYMTLPQFEIQAENIIKQTGALEVAMAPLVAARDRLTWEEYSNSSANQAWVLESLDQARRSHRNDDKNIMKTISSSASGLFSPTISHNFSSPTSASGTIDGDPFYAPAWQVAPITESQVTMNFDFFSFPFAQRVFQNVFNTNDPVLSEAINLQSTETTNSPFSFMATPVFKHNRGGGEIVAFLVAMIPWKQYFTNIIPEGIDGIRIVVSNRCSDDFTFEVRGPNVDFVGLNDLHDSNYDNLKVEMKFETFGNDDCKHLLHIYPTDKFHQHYITRRPLIYAAITILIFFSTASIFFVHECYMERRQTKLLQATARTNEMSNSSTIQEEQLDVEDNDNGEKSSNGTKRYGKGSSRNSICTTIFRLLVPFSSIVIPNDTNVGKRQDKEKHNLSSGDNEGRRRNCEKTSKPVADLFPNATVMFADIAGFTVWASSREPAQVFTLLESVYNSFDTLAKQQKVFKVETIGDCYVAATGLPEPMEDHAVVMARFAHNCMAKMETLVHELEVTLGPETADLGMRFGLHSGPVTAGVLRGEKSRFQLFGDTVNTASLMESSGSTNKIHLSSTTAELILQGCQDLCVRPRDTLTEVKDKIKIQTYWLTSGEPMGFNMSDPYDDDMKSTSFNIDCTSSSSDEGNTSNSTHLDTMELPKNGRTCTNISASIKSRSTSEKIERLINWNVDVLQGLLRKIVAMRKAKRKKNKKIPSRPVIEYTSGNVLEEVKEIITLPSKAAKYYKNDPGSIILSDDVTNQLRDFVTAIASLYEDHPFHSFEHASHVVQSVTKLLSRVVTPDTIDYDDLCYKQHCPSALHKYTYGITSDPLTQFAVALSALIHDVHHPGVPNAQLVKEQTETAILYKNKSVAEQHSVELAWGLLMDDRYKQLRECLYTTQREYERFRQIIVNVVMATDIVDKELGALRKNRWARAFNLNEADCTATIIGESESKQDVNRKATIVIEHLIQASDVSHTMQHWQVYTKWNERFFHECYQAYRNGRAEKDPSEGWYEGEIGFFEFYIIPLAKKLKECGVFGVASDEYLNYAQDNKREWQMKGKALVDKYLEKYNNNNNNKEVEA